MPTQVPQADILSATFAALADPTRRAILARLANGECSVGDLAQPFDMSMPAVSKHLRVLERAGLVAQRRQAQWRHCRIEAAPLKQVADWAERYRRLWEGRLDRLDAYLKSMTAPSSPGAARSPTTTPTSPPPPVSKNPKSTAKQKEKHHDRKRHTK
jgi:DNA-binding transcriptional ArsR family regulator